MKDLYFAETFEGRAKAEMYHEYFTVMRDEIYAHPFINVLAHIDYIARNAPFENPEISYGEFTDDVDAVLRALVETDTVIEINTRRLGVPRGIKELAPVYRRYRELGGRLLPSDRTPMFRMLSGPLRARAGACPRVRSAGRYIP